MNKITDKFGLARPALIATITALVLAALCSAAPGTVIVTGLTTTTTGGTIWDGTHLWVADAVQGFCRVDPIVGGNTLTNCLKPTTKNAGVAPLIGQPAYDAVNRFVYLPDQSTGSNGIWRYHFNGLTFDTPVNIANSLGGQRPGAVVLGPPGDDTLYVSMTANATYQRVSTPDQAAQTVSAMGTTISGTPAHGLAITGNSVATAQLWIADRDGMVQIPNAVGCGNKCKGAINTNLGIISTTSVTVDAANTLMYIGNSFGVFRYALATGIVDLYSKSFNNANGTLGGLLSNVISVGVDGSGNLFYVDDPTGGQSPAATLYTVPFNSPIDGQGPLGSPPPTVPPALVFGTAINNPAALSATGVTTPRGAVYMGTHVWVVDGALGFCQATNTVTNNCAVLPAGFVPGAPAYDSTADNLGHRHVYLPDTSGTNGVYQWPVTVTANNETLGAAVRVVNNSAILKGAPGGTAPVALAFGPDRQIYASIAGSLNIVKVSTPLLATHTVSFIGTMFETGSLSLAFQGANLYDVGVASSSVIYNATVCQGTCTFQFLAVVLNLPTAVAADANYVYIGDTVKVWRYDPVANTFTLMADNGLVGTATTPFTVIGGIALNPNGKQVFPVDQTHVWLLSDKPVLSSVAPGHGSPGTANPVVITGSGLTGGVLNMPAGITATGVTVVSSAEIDATFNVAASAVIGTVPIFTVTANGIVSNALSFSIIAPAPVLNTVTPAVGVQGTSVPVTFAGLNLAGATLNLPTGVTATGVTTTATSLSATLVIAATAPTGPQGISVTTSAGTSGQVTFTINPPPPTLISINPTSGVIGTSVTVTMAGTFLTGSTITYPTGVTASNVVITPTQITALLAVALTAPQGAKTISLTTAGGSASIPFTILPPPPVLTSIAPATGFQGQILAVTLTGSKLTGSTLDGNLTAGISATGVVVVSDTQITATFNVALTATLGPATIVVNNANGASNPVTFTVTLPPPPTITSIAPTSGVAGTTVPVTIAGTTLLGGTLNLPAGVTATGVTATSTQITASLVITAAAATGAKNITVTTPGGTTATPVVFTVNAPVPTLTSIAPNTGVQGTASLPVTIIGTSLTGATLNLPAGVTTTAAPVVTATQITATLAIAATATTGAQNITATTVSGTSGPVTFTVNPPAPTITSITPATGAQGASVPVTIAGTNLLGATLTLPSGVTTTGAPVVTATQITATLAIAANATLGAQTITATTTGGAATVTFNINSPAPTLASMTPTSGTAGTSVPVTFTGTNLLGATLNLPAGVTTAAPPVASATQIAATLVISLTAALGPQNITATTGGGTSGPVTFTIVLPPSVTSITPASGNQADSVPVVIAGANLLGSVLHLPTGVTVVGSPVITVSQITATLAIAANAPAGPGNVTVTTPGGTTTPVTFTVTVPPPPAIAAVAPASGVVLTTVPVTITGSNFLGATLTPPTGVTATGVTVTATQITANFAIAGTAPTGPQTVTVTTPGGSTGATFTVNLPPPPALTSITPALGVTGTTVPVTIVGTALSNGTLAVGAGLTVVSATVVSDTQINASFAVAANAALGPANVTVSTLGGTSNALTFTINPPPPVLTNISQTIGLIGTTVPVTINGTFLTGSTLNLPASITATGVVITATQITGNFVIAAAAPLGATSFTVTTQGGTSNALAFTILAPPALTGIAPAIGVTGTSGAVTITGTALTNATLVVGPGITVVSATAVSDTQINATFSIAANAALGATTVAASTLGVASNALAFTINPPPPALANITPTSAVIGTTVPVTINGNFLALSTMNLPASITFTPTAVTATQITGSFVIDPAAPLGATSFTVTTQGGTSNALAFTIIPPPPVIASITPASAFQGDTVAVVISGQFLTGGTLGAIPGVTVTGFSVVNDTQINATFILTPNAPGGPTGPQNVVITTAGGPTAVPGTFTINQPPPTVSGISPASGNQGTSVPVTINGTNLTAVTLNLPAGITATGVTGNGSSITATLVIDPAAPIGAQSITVTTPGGTTGAVSFTVVPPPPTLTLMSTPTIRRGGNTVVNQETITGTHLTTATLAGLNFNPALSGVTLSGFTVLSDTQVRVTFSVAPTATAGAFALTVTTPGGTSNALTFTIL
ncbi:MAG: IPT/TIG domain-containing protein [Acidobacteriia bacterium]|nr:IPT/TIG domain-containing protein [Terriglobia bacterium]